jgi:hypothetical protein
MYKWTEILLKNPSTSLLENLKKSSGNNKQNHPISMDTFYEYFKNLKNYEDDDDIDRP